MGYKEKGALTLYFQAMATSSLIFFLKKYGIKY